MRITPTRPNVVTVTATRTEMAALAAGARVALDLLERDPDAPDAPRALLARVLEDYDAALGRLTEGDI
jgi:hypothetical protein